MNGKKGVALLCLGVLLALTVQSTALAAPTRYEAETAPAQCDGTIDSNHAGFSGTGFCNATNAVGAAAQFTVNAASVGTATVNIRYANGTTGSRPADIVVNDTVVQAASAFNPTADWTTWATKSLTARVNAGTNTIRLVSTTAGGLANVDYLDFEAGPSDTVAPTTPGTPACSNPTSSGLTLTWAGSTDNVGVTGYKIYSGGTAVQNVSGNPPATSANLTGLAPNTTYTLSVSATDAAGNESARAGSVSCTTQAGGTGTPVGINGQLHVCGVQLCNQYNHPIQLRGMSSHGLQWYYQCLNAASLDALAGDWNADVLRISMYIQEGGYETNPRQFTDRVHSLIEMATARGMYAIVDWHMLDPGDPNANLSRARTFFTEIANRHKDKVNILYEVANEPSGVSWTTIRNYHQQIIPMVRAEDVDAVILLGTRAWSSLGVSDGANETEVINNPVNAANIMYTFHFYAASHGSTYLNTLSRAANSLPMFVTEFGTQQASGDGGNNFTMSQQYLDLMAQKKISWVNWNYSDDFRTGAVFPDGTCPGGPFAGASRLKPAGVWVRDRIRTPDNFPTG